VLVMATGRRRRLLCGLSAFLFVVPLVVGTASRAEAASFASLTLVNGWKPISATSNPAVTNLSGIVTLTGAIKTTGTNAVAFTLPTPFRPATEVYVPVDLCNASNGRLRIDSGGLVSVQAEGGKFSNAQCFTSLDGASFARTTTGYTPLTLQNGWANAPFGTSSAEAASISGIVHLKGAISGGTSSVVFTLPAQFRPARNVFVPVDLCNAAKGTLFITPSGAVTVEAEGGKFSNAQCFTSLDGASFASTTAGFTSLVLQNGWTNAPFGTSNAAATNLSGVVHLKGAISSGTTSTVFTLPLAFRPATTVYVPVDLCNATNGRLMIDSGGVVHVQAEGLFSNAQCFTSLDGAVFNATAVTALTLANGWMTSPGTTSPPAASLSSGIVTFAGAMSTNGVIGVAFTLPAQFRPAKNVYVPVDLCSAAKGRLTIAPSGVVSVQAAISFASAQCFTSLDGASFANATTGFTSLVLQNGWTEAPSGTANAAVASIAGIVHLKGAIANGTTSTVFTLPAPFRPAANVFVQVSLCGAHNGRLDITPGGVVTVESQGGTFPDAQCLTSLDGASFATATTGYAPLTLVNGWSGAPFGTANPSVGIVSGIVHFKGAIASGTSSLASTLPAAYRPAATVYVPVDMCNATNGRLIIGTDGSVIVQAESSFSNAQCFTSLDGAWYDI
jgi:hypothetical protein